MTTMQQVDVLELLDTEPVPLVETVLDLDAPALTRHFGAQEPHDAQDVLDSVVVADDDAAS